MQSGLFLFMQIDQLIPQETQQATMMKIYGGEQGLVSGDRNDHCTADDDDDLPTSTINANIEQIFQNLTLHVMSVSERPPPVQVV